MSEKEDILKSYCLELEVTDAWQLPAIYKIYKDESKVEINELCFSLKLTESEYNEFLDKVINRFKIDTWEYNYELSADEKAEDDYSWKLVIYFDENKKIIKRGKNTAPKEFDDLEEYLIEVTE